MQLTLGRRMRGAAGSWRVRVPFDLSVGELKNVALPSPSDEVRIGMFERTYVDLLRVKLETNTPATVALARMVAEKVIVILKNDGVPPLNPRAKMRLAVIGPNAVEASTRRYSAESDRKTGVRATVGPYIKADAGSLDITSLFRSRAPTGIAFKDAKAQKVT